GKGIGALLGDEQDIDPSSLSEVALSALKPNPQQPRRGFDETALRELADSIRQKGVLQPVLAEASPDGGYIIVAGERRVRAARLAGLDRVPVLVRQFSSEEKLEIALIENVQREDLNPIEEALAYRNLMEIAGLSQEQIAGRVGKDRSTVANTLRLLKLPREAQDALEKGALSPGHARAMLALVNPADQQVLFKRILDKGISVREAEELAAAFSAGKRQSGKSRRAGQPPSGRRDPQVREIEQKLIEKLGTKVEVKGDGRKGRIEIAYYSTEDLERLLGIIL
ncbi:MAG TPA: ParB/RepB/Spo0J family partition protein, partial [Spirochaetia bacterium]|nr:ParB/RepB/Spo0J family partition protein [Spirochaetia bacterium]